MKKLILLLAVSLMSCGQERVTVKVIYFNGDTESVTYDRPKNTNLYIEDGDLYSAHGVLRGGVRQFTVTKVENL